MLLSDAKIRSAKHREKPYRLRDGQGLFLLVHPNGSKYWQYRYKFGGKERTPVSFGKYPQVGLSDARDKRHAAQKLLEENIDPNSEKRRKRLEAQFIHNCRFELVAEEWHDTKNGYVSPKHGARTWRRVELNLLPQFGKRPIADIRPLEVLQALKIVEARGSTSESRRVLQICGAIFRYAVVTGRIDFDPSASLGAALRSHRVEHYPTLISEELPEFLEALRLLNTSKQNHLAFRLLLLTALRTGELRHARWEDVNFVKREWRVQASSTKMRREHLVPLSKQAIDYLLSLRTISGECEWLFPSQQGYRHKVMSENTINHMIERMGYKGRIVGHGFRSLFSTTLNENGFNRDAIERQLAHVEKNKVRAAYNRAEYYQERRFMMQWWADFLDAANRGEITGLGGVGDDSQWLTDPRDRAGITQFVDANSDIVHTPSDRPGAKSNGFGKGSRRDSP